jgi:hypothetical protein
MDAFFCAGFEEELFVREYCFQRSYEPLDWTVWGRPTRKCR